MAQNIKIAGATYSGVPSIKVPLSTGSGDATFYDCTGSKNITANGTVDVTGLASVIVNVSGGGGGLPTGFTAIAKGTHTLNSAVTGSSTFTVTHNLGVVPDMFCFMRRRMLPPLTPCCMRLGQQSLAIAPRPT